METAQVLSQTRWRPSWISGLIIRAFKLERALVRTEYVGSYHQNLTNLIFHSPRCDCASTDPSQFVCLFQSYTALLQFPIAFSVGSPEPSATFLVPLRTF